MTEFKEVIHYEFSLTEGLSSPYIFIRNYISRYRCSYFIFQDLHTMPIAKFDIVRNNGYILHFEGEFFITIKTLHECELYFESATMHHKWADMLNKIKFKSIEEMNKMPDFGIQLSQPKFEEITEKDK